MSESKVVPGFPSLSKRAARRLIQRAFVLVGRDRRLRERLRAARVMMLWVLEDWRFAWTVELDRGKLHFERRPAKRPDVTLTWRSAGEFFRQIESGVLPKDGFGMEGSVELQRFSEPVSHAFFIALGGLLHNPVDEDCESLL